MENENKRKIPLESITLKEIDNIIEKGEEIDFIPYGNTSNFFMVYHRSLYCKENNHYRLLQENFGELNQIT